MQFVRVKSGDEKFYGQLEGGQVKRLTQAPYLGIEYDGQTYALGSVELLAPAEPSKVVCIGQNYLDHKYEVAEIPPTVDPVLFLKPSTTITGPECEVDYPEICNNLHYEAELGGIIG